MCTWNSDTETYLSEFTQIRGQHRNKHIKTNATEMCTSTKFVVLVLNMVERKWKSRRLYMLGEAQRP